VNTQAALKMLFELRAVLDRLGEGTSTLREAVAHDVERAIRLTNNCIAELTEENPEEDPEADQEAEEEEEE